eukprot:SAG22_NODE_720_length_7649_cov_16.537616_3_plen_185_part_00
MRILGQLAWPRSNLLTGRFVSFPVSPDPVLSPRPVPPLQAIESMNLLPALYLTTRFALTKSVRYCDQPEHWAPYTVDGVSYATPCDIESALTLCAHPLLLGLDIVALGGVIGVLTKVSEALQGTPSCLCPAAAQCARAACSPDNLFGNKLFFACSASGPTISYWISTFGPRLLGLSRASAVATG